MAVDMFLKIEGIKGEAPDKTHKDEIEIQSFSWGASQQGTMSGGGGGGAGKVSMQDFSFVMNTNKASPVLFLSCAVGKHIPSALLTVRKAGDKQQEYLKVKFTDILISSYQTSGSANGDLTMDSVSLNFAKIEFEYAPQKLDGTLEAPVKAGYDLKQQTRT